MADIVEEVKNVIPTNITSSKIWHILVTPIMTILFLVLCIIMIVYSFKGLGDNYIQGILNDVLQKYQVEYQLKMSEKDKQINNLTNQLKTSEIAVVKLKNELFILKTEVSKIEEPVDLKEIKARLGKMGFNVK